MRGLPEGRWLRGRGRHRQHILSSLDSRFSLTGSITAIFEIAFATAVVVVTVSHIVVIVAGVCLSTCSFVLAYHSHELCSHENRFYFSIRDLQSVFWPTLGSNQSDLDRKSTKWSGRASWTSKALRTLDFDDKLENMFFSELSNLWMNRHNYFFFRIVQVVLAPRLEITSD